EEPPRPEPFQRGLRSAVRARWPAVPAGAAGVRCPAAEEESRVPRAYLTGFSLRPRTSSSKLTPFTWMTLYRTPGMSPYDRPMRPPIPSTRTSSCSSMKLIAPSPAAIPRADPISLSSAGRGVCNIGPTSAGSGVRPSVCALRTDPVPTIDPGRVRSKSHVLFKGRVPRKSRVRREGDDPFAVRAYDAFLREVPRVDVAAAVRAGANEVLLFQRILGDELIGGPVDGPFDEALAERLPEELLRLEPRPPESL